MLDNSQLIFAATESKIYAKEFDPILESTRPGIPSLSLFRGFAAKPRATLGMDGGVVVAAFSERFFIPFAG